MMGAPNETQGRSDRCRRSADMTWTGLRERQSNAGGTTNGRAAESTLPEGCGRAKVTKSRLGGNWALVRWR
jgi:hypothetical protein